MSQQSGSVMRKIVQGYLCLDAGHCSGTFRSHTELDMEFRKVKGEPVVSRLRGRLCRSNGGLTSS